MDCSPPSSSVHGGSPGKNIGVGCHALLQGIFPTQGSSPGLPHCRRILHCLSPRGSPYSTASLGQTAKNEHGSTAQRGFSKLKLCTLLLESLGAAIFEKYLKTVFLALLALQDTDDHILKLRNFSAALRHNEDVDQAAFGCLHMRVFQPGAETCVTAPSPHVMTYHHRGTACQRSPDKKAARDWSELWAQQQGCRPNLLVKAAAPPHPPAIFS